jgi:hypothetical protein
MSTAQTTRLRRMFVTFELPETVRDLLSKEFDVTYAAAGESGD